MCYIDGVQQEQQQTEQTLIDKRLRESGFGRTINVTEKPKMIEPMPKVLPPEDMSEQCCSD